MPRVSSDQGSFGKIQGIRLSEKYQENEKICVKTVDFKKCNNEQCIRYKNIGICVIFVFY